VSYPGLTARAIRPFRFRPAVVRLVVPEGAIGAYLLFRVVEGVCRAVYVGRSDTDLRRRLLQHPHRALDYFTVQGCGTAAEAYLAECRVFHLLEPELNQAHPAAVAGRKPECPFCETDLVVLRVHARELCA
jgi:hypothetical protein